MSNAWRKQQRQKLRQRLKPCGRGRLARARPKMQVSRFRQTTTPTSVQITSRLISALLRKKFPRLCRCPRRTCNPESADEVEAGRLHDSRQDAGATTPTPSTADILKFLIDRTGYIKLLEQEDTPEAYLAD